MDSWKKLIRFSGKDIRPLLWLAVALAVNLLWWVLWPPAHLSWAGLNRFYTVLPGILACIQFIRIIRTDRSLAAVLFGLGAAGLAFWILRDMLSIFLPARDPPVMMQTAIRWLNLGGWLLLAGSVITHLLAQQRVTMKLKLLLDLVITSGAFVVLWYVLLINPGTPTGAGSSLPPSDSVWYPVQDLILVAFVANVLLLSGYSSQQKILLCLLAAFSGFYLHDYSLVFPSPDPPALANLSLAFAYAAVLWSISYAPRLSSDLNRQENTPQEVPGWAIRERIQNTLPVALPIVMIGELMVFWIRNQPIEQTVLVASAVIWLLLIARLGVAAGEFELQQYALLFLNSAEAAFLCDSRGRFILVNPAWMRLFGVDTRQQLLRLKLGNVFPGVGYTTGSVPPALETILKSSSGEKIPVELALQPMELGMFRRKLLTGVVHDLRTQKQQQQILQDALDRVNSIQLELQKLNEELELRVADKTRSLSEAYNRLEEQHTRLQSLDQMKSDFVSLVSHELRAPLTNISGGIELLLAGKKPLPDPTRQSLELVMVEIKRLTRFVETILDLSMLDAGKLPLYPEKITRDDLVHSLVSHYRTIPDYKRLKWQIPTAFPPVRADSQALLSVFVHVIDNAIKYAPVGEIVVSGQAVDGRGVICVSDAGPGIPPEIRSHVFDQFYRVENADARAVYGHGLGLYMARKLLQAMDGTIQVSDSDTGGAYFEISLPLWYEDNP